MNKINQAKYSLLSEKWILNNRYISAKNIYKKSLLLIDNISYLQTMIRWLLTVKKNYRNIAYHNWRHAFNVCQVMFALLHVSSLSSHSSFGNEKD